MVEIRRVGVAGGGLTGSCFAQACARAGFATTPGDVSAPAARGGRAAIISSVNGRSGRRLGFGDCSLSPPRALECRW